MSSVRGPWNDSCRPPRLGVDGPEPRTPLSFRVLWLRPSEHCPLSPARLAGTPSFSPFGAMRLRSLAIASLFLVPPLLPSEASGVQWAENPVVPRGTLGIEVRALGTSFHEVRDSEGRGQPLAPFLHIPALTVQHLPALEAAQSRFRALAQNSTGTIDLGGVTTRIHRDEQAFPIRAMVGVTDRLTVGATATLLRRRTEMSFAFPPEGTNVGRNPLRSHPQEVASFQAASALALNQLTAHLAENCGPGGGGVSDECSAGTLLRGRVATFLQELGATYAEEALFPLGNSPIGADLSARWSELADAMERWGVSSPHAVPTASLLLTEQELRALLLEGWPIGHAPQEDAPSSLEFGDLELHLAARLLDRNFSPTAAGSPLGVFSALTATLRLGTGRPDSLAAFAPSGGQPRGVSGITLGWMTELRFNRSLALRSAAEWTRFGSRAFSLFIPDAEGPFGSGQNPVAASFNPGSQLLLHIHPDLILGESLRVGLRWEWRHSEADVWELTSSTVSPSPPLDRGERSEQRLGGELRLLLGGSLPGGLLRPAEISLRGSWNVAGEGGPIAREFQLGVRSYPRF